jgi:two-component system sensor histidine kinase KdpD
MGFAKSALPVAASLVIVAVVTAILWDFKLALSLRHLVYFYLLPTAVVAFFWGSVAAMFAAVVAIICAAFFLYDPIFSFYVADPLQVGELVSFAVLALLGSKCAAEILRSEGKSPTGKFPTRRL